jgi:hypothetical protein
MTLANQLAVLAVRNVMPRLGYYVRSEVRSELISLKRTYEEKRQIKNHDLLDYKMQALNEAFNALIDNDSRLDAEDRVAICAMVRKLCAPSRINEIVCSSIDDFVTVEDYAQKPIYGHATHSAHQLLVIMKGSKGASWSAKPVLSFMIDAFHFTEKVIKEHSARSRMLIEWYQLNPSKLYLPPSLEQLRGQALSRRDLSCIMYLSEQATQQSAAVELVFNALRDFRFKAKNPYERNHYGKINARKIIDFIPWYETEKYLLQRINAAMETCRKVTQLNHYEGDLSKMLFLFDRDRLPYIPYALNDESIRNRLKQRNAIDCPPSLFAKLNITIPVNGHIRIAEMDTHDPRRWLTTMALQHGEKLSDVLINKWANRSSLAQLKSYDFRTSEDVATLSSMPEIGELKDLSEGLAQARKLEDTYGLKTDFVVVHDAGISVTSMDRILQAVEDRPIARTSEQIIIVYPTRYGACLHQHHESPCTRYATCLTCDRNICVKGHIPTNDEIRKDATMLTNAIIRQLDTLIPALNRELADCPDVFAEHLSMLVRRGLCIEQMAEELIDEFQSLKDQIKDSLLRNRLEEAFVACGYVQLLNDEEVSAGALMKYQNPKQHPNPGMEIALDNHGGRELVANNERELIQRFPIFAAVNLGLRDDREFEKKSEDEEGG